MMIRKVLMVIGTAALFSACNHDNSNSGAPATDVNGGLSFSSVLTQNDLNLLANADFNERQAFPAFANRSDNEMPDLSESFGALGNFSSSFASVNSNCSSGVMDYDQRSFDAQWNCPGVVGNAHINASNVTVNVDVTGQNSSVSLNRIYTTGTEAEAGAAFVIDRVASDSLKLANDTYKVDGDSKIAFETLEFFEKINVIVSGQIAVSKNSSAAQIITITSENVGYLILPDEDGNSTAQFCDGSVTYSTVTGLKKTLSLPACPQVLL